MAEINNAQAQETESSAVDTEVIQQPLPNELLEINIEPGAGYLYDFNSADIESFAREGDDLTIYFKDTNTLVLKNHISAVNDDEPASILFTDETVAEQFQTLFPGLEGPAESELFSANDPLANFEALTEEEQEDEGAAGEQGPDVQASLPESLEEPVERVILQESAQEAVEEILQSESALDEIAEQLREIEPAAGDEAAQGRGGFGFQSNFTPDDINAPQAIGALGETALQYGINPVTDDVFPRPEEQAQAAGPVDSSPQSGAFTEAVDETNLDAGPVNVNGQVNVNFGADGPGEICANDSFQAGGSLANNALTSGGVPVIVTGTPGGYTGTVNGQTIFTLTINQQTGEYEFTLFGPLDHADGTDPNDVISLTFGVKASDSDGDTVQTTITVNVADDAPLPLSQGDNTVDETDLGPTSVNGTFNVDFGADGTGEICANGDVVVGGSVAGGTLTSGGNPVTINSTPGGYTGTVNGQTIFTLTINQQTGAYEFTLFGPLDHADGTNPDDIITIDFGVKATDWDGDSTDGVVTINIADDAPFIGNDSATVDEDSLDNGGTITVNGNLAQDFGADGPGEICADGMVTVDGSSNFSLTSGGQPVTITSTPAGYVGTAGGQTVFTLTLNQNTGAYEFTMVGGLDHANPNNPITIDFGVKIVDGDNDTDKGTITITIQDGVPEIADTPEVGAGIENVDETNLGPIIVNGQLDIEFGTDGAGSVNPNGGFVAGGSLAGNALTSDGQAVTVTQTASGYVGTAGGQTIFTLTINDNGSYEFTLLGPLDHANPNNPNDVITLEFGVDAVDGDGSSDSGVITVNVADDAPFIGFDTQSADEADLSNGPVVLNGKVANDYGADGPGAIDASGNFTAGGSLPGGVLSSGGQPVTVTHTAGGYTGTVGGQTIFTLTINDNGDYTFTLFGEIDHANTNDPITLDFGTIISDEEGDTDNGNIRITIVDGDPDLGDPDIGNDTQNVDETDLGPISINGQLGVDYGADGAGSVAGNGTFTASGSLAGGSLTSGGQPVVVTLNQKGDYVGTAGGQTIFTLELNDNGTYEFTLIGTLDHADGNNPNDIIELNFEVEISDADGDTDTGIITINVADDAPSIGNASRSTDESSGLPNTVNGQVAVDFGEDGPGSLGVNGGFNASGSLAGGTLTSGGQAVVVTQTASGYVGTAGGQTIFTLELNNNGSFEFTLLGPLDHADPNDPNDIINLQFGVEVTDFDGDSDSGFITISVADDAPIIGDDPTVGNGLEIVDETNLGPIVVNGNLSVDFGAGENGTVSANGTFVANGSMAGGTLTSGGQAVVVAQTAGGYVGTAGGQTIFTLELNDNGSYEFTLIGTLDHADGNNPNDVITLLFGVEASDNDGDSDSGFIRVDVRDDVPTISDRVGDVDETSLDNGPVSVTRTMSVDFGEDGPGEVQPNGTFVAKFEPNGQGVTLTSGGQAVVVTQTADGYVGKVGNQTIFTLSINSANGTHTYTQYQAIDHPDGTDPDDVIWLKFGVEAVDFDGDSADAFIVVDVHDDGPVIGNAQNQVDETDMGNGSVSASGQVNVDFGADGPGDVSGNGTFVAGGSLAGGTLTSGGVAVVVTLTAAGYVGKANGQTVFTLDLNDNGGYEFTLHRPLDHADPNDPNDIIDLRFGIEATDGDGDSDDGFITISVADDVPFIDDQPVLGNSSKTIDETNDINKVISGQLSVDYGDNGPGSLGVNGTFNSNGSMTGGTLTSDGVAIVVTQTASGYVGKAGSQTVFTLDLNNNGSYQFRLFKALDHADGNNPNDVINLNFGVEIEDSDGDTDDGYITISVRDDAPLAVNDSFSTSHSVSGNITNNDDFGEDGAGFVTAIEGLNIGTQGRTINGQFGTLEINRDGTFTYTAFNNVEGTDRFDYTIVDGDGDRDSAVLSITVDTDDVPRIDGTALSVDETNLGPIVVNGNINVDFGADGAGSVDPTGTFVANGSMTGGTLTSNGTAVVVTQTAGGYVGRAGSETIFTLDLNDNGTYQFTLRGNLDHADGNNPNDVITLRFGVEVTDGDSDKDSDFITVNVLDDVPVIGNSSRNIDEADIDHNGATVSGQLTVDFGADGPGTIDGTGTFTANGSLAGGSLKSNGVAVAVMLTASGYVGKAGSQTVFTLDLNDNGSYSFTLYQPLDHASEDGVINLSFGVEATDDDGDSDDGFITISVADDVPFIDDQPVLGNSSKTIDETNDINKVISGQLSVDYGDNGAGSLGPSGTFISNGSLDNGVLTSNGQAIIVTQTASGYVGKAGSQTVFTLTVQNNGSYQFNLLRSLDHADPNNPDDVINLNFGVEIEDSDGDTDDGFITIAVRDDAPVAADDNLGGIESVRFATDPGSNKGELTESGNLLSNDRFGNDSGSLTSVTINGVTHNFGSNGSIRIIVNENNNTPDGQAYIEIRSDGSYKVYTGWDWNPTNPNYIPNQAVDYSGRQDHNYVMSAQQIDAGNIRYTITDRDGDTDTAIFRFTLNGTPLVIDLDGDGVELTNVENGVLFDMGADGTMDQTAWVGADDGLLAIDLNNDGRINDHSELFGSMLEDGFSILSNYDTNADGLIDASDERFADILVWQDVNTDGVSDDGELFSLTDLGIVSINANAMTTDYEVNGNWISHESTFTYADGSTGQIVDAWFDMIYGGGDNPEQTVTPEAVAEAIAAEEVLYAEATDAILDQMLEAANENSEIPRYNNEAIRLLGGPEFANDEERTKEDIKSFEDVVDTENGLLQDAIDSFVYNTDGNSQLIDKQTYNAEYAAVTTGIPAGSALQQEYEDNSSVI